MRVAALYDVHGNAPALAAVLAEPEVAGADVVLLGGDIASGPFPAETLELVRSLANAVAIRGNADELSSAGLDEAGTAARRWVAERVGHDAVRWLEELPLSWTVDDTLYVHANPIDVRQYVTPATPDERVADLLDGVTERQVVTGHVHLQFERDVRGIRWIGAGSVGCPYVASDPAAEWVLVADGRVQFRRTPYDVERVDAAIVASSYPRARDYVETRASGARWVSTAV